MKNPARKNTLMQKRQVETDTRSQSNSHDTRMAYHTITAKMDLKNVISSVTSCFEVTCQELDLIIF